MTYDTASGTPDISNTYFIPVTNLTANQGKQAQTITAGENVINLAISGAPTEYDLSGITAYEGNPGLKYNSLLYAGSQDVINLTLASAEPENGRYFYQYATSGGSLFTNSPTNATLIMPDGTTAISAIIDKKIPTIFLADTEDNTSLLSANDGVTRNVILPGRTLQTGSYNTFAVPFDIPASQYDTYNIIAVKKLTGSSYDSSTGVLTLNFADENAKIEAGHPYLVKVSANTMSPTFDEVLIYAEAKPVTTTAVNFVPTFGKTEVTDEEKSILFVTGDNKLTYPSGNGNINGFRAYFQLKGAAATNARSFIMNLGNDEVITQIMEMLLTANLASGAYWSTFYSNADNFQAPEGTQVFTVNLTGTTLTLNEITDRIVKSGEGVVLKQTTTSSTATTTIPMTLTNATPTGDFSGNSLTGTMTSITNPGNAYVLGGKNGAGFYKLSANGTIGANKAYLIYSGASAKEYFCFEEDATRVANVNVNDNDNCYYDLQGRCVSNGQWSMVNRQSLKKGLYIVNGKKIVIK